MTLVTSSLAWQRGEVRAEDETGAAVLAAASRLLRAEGVDALSVRRVAAEAGQTTMAVYSRFGGKAGLLEALLREGFDVLAAAQARVPITDDARAELIALCVAYRNVARKHSAHYAVMTGGVVGFAPSAEVRARAAGGALARLVDASTRYLASVRSPTPPLTLATALFGASHGLCALELGGWLPDPNDAEIGYRRTLEALLDGFAIVPTARPSTPPPAGTSSPRAARGRRRA